jgi:hypothetical protein
LSSCETLDRWMNQPVIVRLKSPSNDTKYSIIQHVNQDLNTHQSMSTKDSYADYCKSVGLTGYQSAIFAQACSKLHYGFGGKNKMTLDQFAQYMRFNR